MQQQRHASRRRIARLRPVLRSGIVGVLAVPSALGVTTAATALHLPRVADSAAGGGTAAVLATKAPAPRPAVTAVARSAVRAGHPAPPTPSPAPTPTPSTMPVRDVVGLGDSVPAGSACDCSDYVTLFAQSMGRSQGAPVRTTNLASSGETSGDLLARLDDADTRSAVAAADVVVLTVGANDIEDMDPTSCQANDGEDSDATVASCYGAQLDALARNLDRALARVSDLTAPGARVLVTGYWNVFLDGSAGRARGATYMQLADAATRAVNTRIADAAEAHGGNFVDLFTPFRGTDGSRDCTDLLAPDGDHPDADGHALIARALAAAL